jgi:hypothetical protein
MVFTCDSLAQPLCRTGCLGCIGGSELGVAAVLTPDLVDDLGLWVMRCDQRECECDHMYPRG